MIRRVFLSLLLFPLLLLAGAALWLFSSLPVTKGRVSLQGLSARVAIERDIYGVPTIRAANERDAAFALGYVHAQDRLFQMEQTRRAGAGRLSEVLGESTIWIDRQMRLLGLARAVERQWERLAPETRALGEAYAAGVNAWLDNRRTALPPEFYLLRFRPERWKATDSLLWAKLMALQLSGNYRGEIFRARVAQLLGEDALKTLFPQDPPEGASNNWVVSGAHTESGKPLLANDPHLGFSAPSPFYLARLEWPGTSLAGITAPGVPFVIIGHNQNVAWGFTTTGGDVQDTFLEKLDGDGYVTPDGTRPFMTRQETIQVRNAAPVTMTVRQTRHGPVVSDTLGEGAVAPGFVLALQITYLGPEDRTPDALYAMNRAKNADEFVRALENFHAPQQSIVFADAAGRIGMVAPARIPVRKSGNGWLPSPGWTGEADWTRMVPFEGLPQLHDPPSGKIVTANNDIVPPGSPWFIGRDFDRPYRAERIEALLNGGSRQSQAASAAIQADNFSRMAEELLPLMLPAPPASERAREAIARLAAWDRMMEADKTEPLLFTAWLRELTRALFAERLGALFEDYLEFRPLAIRNVLTREKEWCRGPCEARLTESLEAALADLERRFGADMQTWLWGRAHPARFTNNVLSRVPVLKDLWRVEITTSGGYDTVNRGHISLRNQETPFANVHGSVFRTVIDLAAPDAAWFIIAPGQSGNPFSRHYDDLVETWGAFRWLTLDGKNGGDRLELVPR